MRAIVGVQFKRAVGARIRAGLACTAVFAAGAAAAITADRVAPADVTLVAAADISRRSVEVNGSTLPRFDNIDGNTRASRVDVSLMPQAGSGMGLAVGINNFTGASPAFSSQGAAPQVMDLGLRWRYIASSSARFDLTAYRRMPNADAISLVESRDPSYVARVEIGMGSTPLRKGFVADRGFFGLQLEGGARLTMRRKNGGPMLYYRNDF